MCTTTGDKRWLRVLKPMYTTTVNFLLLSLLITEFIVGPSVLEAAVRTTAGDYLSLSPPITEFIVCPSVLEAAVSLCAGIEPQAYFLA